MGIRKGVDQIAQGMCSFRGDGPAGADTRIGQGDEVFEFHQTSVAHQRRLRAMAPERGGFVGVASVDRGEGVQGFKRKIHVGKACLARQNTAIPAKAQSCGSPAASSEPWLSRSAGSRVGSGIEIVVVVPTPGSLWIE